MFKGKSKGQIALEFLIVYSLVLLIFVIIFALIVNQRAASLGQDEYQSLQLAAQNIAIHIDQAVIAGNGYSAIVPIPPVTSTDPYRLFVATSGVVEANITIGTTKAEAIAYSSGRNLIVNGTKVESSGGVSIYNVSTYTGSIEITNGNGNIYIDELPPSTSNLADSLYLKDKGETEAASFNGQNSGIIIPANNFPSGSEPGISIFAWVKTTRSSEGVFEYYAPSNNICQGSVRLEINPQVTADFSCDSATMGPAVNNNQWNFIGWTIPAGTANVIFYVNGVAYGPASISPINIPTSGLEGLIGAPYPGWNYFNGSLTNVQLYNTSLSTNDVQVLYQEGIAGAPVNPQNLVAWYPLNGNTNDYSGNVDNGVPYNITYVDVAEFGVSTTLTNGKGASHSLVGISTNTGIDSINPEYITQPNKNYIAGITNSSGNATIYYTSNTTSFSNSGQAYLFNGNSTTIANLRLWMPLEEGQGSDIYDYSGYFNSGDFTDPNWVQLQQVSSSFDVGNFDGSNSYDNATTAETYARGITISAWINNTGSGSYWQNIASVSGGPYTPEAFGIGITGANGAAVARWNNEADSLSPGSSSAPQPYGGTLTANEPYLVTGVWNGANNTITVYINGNPVASSAGNGTSAVAIGKITIGSPFPSGMYDFSGRISNVQVYNTSVPLSYIKQMYAAGMTGAPISNAGLVAWFPLDGEPNDYSQYNYPVNSNSITYSEIKSLSNNTGAPSSAKIPSFNGSSSASHISMPPLKILNGHSSYSINTWLEYKGGSQYFNQNPFAVGWGGCTMGFMFTPPSDIVFTDWYTSNAINPPGCPTSGNAVYSSAFELLPYTLYMVTATYNSSTGIIDFYTNGQYNSNATIPAGDYMSNYTETGYIGDNLDGNTGTEYFNGSVADVQVYNTTLTPYQIKQLYVAGLPLEKSFNFSIG
ncbi:MAG: LamG domain-containing protein [Candidatus Marsarchaeota archaeon]|nr:LamG domain-containing protein [Candidatus Marsarchaeota archaeon]